LCPSCDCTCNCKTCAKKLTNHEHGRHL
jgi:hypothetical protein